MDPRRPLWHPAPDATVKEGAGGAEAVPMARAVEETPAVAIASAVRPTPQRLPTDQRLASLEGQETARAIPEAGLSRGPVQG